jgi:hypothetical protein
MPVEVAPVNGTKASRQEIEDALGGFPSPLRFSLHQR